MMVRTIMAQKIYKTVGVGIMPYDVDKLPEDWLVYIDALAGLK